MNLKDLRDIAELTDGELRVKVYDELVRGFFLEFADDLEIDWKYIDCISDGCEDLGDEVQGDFDEVFYCDGKDFSVRIAWTSSATKHAEYDDGMYSTFYENESHDIKSVKVTLWDGSYDYDITNLKDVVKTAYKVVDGLDF